MLTKRLIPCLDVSEGKVVKGVRFRDHQVMGDILELALRYREQGADELVFYDITASPEGRSLSREWVERIADVLDIPFCVAGGIRDVNSARAVLNAGADKVSVNSPALERPELLMELAEEFGTQCVVLGIDSILVDGIYRVRQYTGKESSNRDSGRQTLEWIQEACTRGAGEVVLNCIDQDGVRAGYDIEQLRAVRAICPVPLIASGGAGTVEHFAAVFKNANVDGALAASVFHSGKLTVPEVKDYLATQGIAVRMQ